MNIAMEQTEVRDVLLWQLEAKFWAHFINIACLSTLRMVAHGHSAQSCLFGFSTENLVVALRRSTSTGS